MARSAVGQLQTFSVFGGNVRFRGAASTGRRNTRVKSFCRRFKLKRFALPFVELTCHLIKIGLRVSRQVRSLGEVLSEQTIRVLVGAALPWTSRVAEVNLYAGRQAKLFIGAELLAPRPFGRLVWIEGAEAALS